MKLLIIRHGDPDYERDTLTEKGWREAEYLEEKLSNMEIHEFYVSPLGRARDTASCTLQKMNRTAQTCQWLREFDAPIWRPDVPDQKKICWDWLPADWMAEERHFSCRNWYETPALQEGNVKKEYDWVCGNLDQLLQDHGYVRDGYYYRAERPNEDTLAFFCHFGLGCVLLSHLLNISPMVLWHNFCAAPSSVTTVVTEERRKGTASFRMLAYGDTSHLYANGEAPSVSARFCERFENMQERHD